MSQSQRKLARILIIGVVLLVVVSLSIIGCKRDDTSAQKDQAKKSKEIGAHAISAEEEKLLMKQTRANIKIITEVTTDTSPLKKALIGQAFAVFSDQLKTDAAEGKIKIRRYGSVKLKIKNITKGVAGMSLSFIDRSYYVDKDTLEKVSSPLNKKEDFILALRKDGKRWKIFTFFTTQLKEQKK